MTGERGAGGAGFGCGVRDNQRHMGIFLVAHRTLALQTAVRSRHLAVIRREADDRVPPQIHFVQDIHALLNPAVAVQDGVQVVVGEAGPHTLAIRGDRALRVVPTSEFFPRCPSLPGAGEWFLQTCWECGRSSLFVEQVCWSRRDHLLAHAILNWGSGRYIAARDQSVVRMSET